MDNNNNEKNTKHKMTIGEIVRMIIAIIACLISLAAFTLVFMFGSLPQNLQMLPFIMLAVAIIILLVLKTTGKNGKYADKLGSELAELAKESADIPDDETTAEDACTTDKEVTDIHQTINSDSSTAPTNKSDDTAASDSTTEPTRQKDTDPSNENDMEKKKEPLKLKKFPPHPTRK